MKIYEYSHEYSGYTFPTVSLAYFLRYPNPYSKHVLSTDTISQHIDDHGRLHTTRLHLKKSKIPAAVLKFMPKAMAGKDGQTNTYILESTIVDPKEGWMETESRNMEWTGVLSVIEKQKYTTLPQANSKLSEGQLVPVSTGTSCKTTTTLVSRLGQGLLKRRKAGEDEPKQGWFASLGTHGIQAAVEFAGLKKTQTALVNSSHGMRVVLERLRNGGVKNVLEGMRHDRMEMMGVMIDQQDSWRDVWQKGKERDD